MNTQAVKFQIERAKNNQFYVNITKGKKVLFTSETYHNKKAGAVKAAKALGATDETIVDNAPKLPKKPKTNVSNTRTKGSKR